MEVKSCAYEYTTQADLGGLGWMLLWVTVLDNMEYLFNHL